jgi:uncharacterized protein (DUF58 family)
VLAAGSILLGAGALTGVTVLAALGLLALGALVAAYVHHAPRASEVFQGGVKLAWWLEPEAGAPRTVIVGRPLLLRIALRCHAVEASSPLLRLLGRRRGPGRERPPTLLGLARLAPVAHPALFVQPPTPTPLLPAREARICGRVIPRAAGTFVLHGATLDLEHPLGLFRLQAYFPNPLRVSVLPRAMAEKPALLAATLATHERAGRRLARRAGLGDELREIREHAHGDPWKRIAWAATARTGQLMVRDFDMDVTYTYHLLVDASAAMRRGAPGQTPFDAAVEGATALARAALEAGDRVALSIFAGRPLVEIKPGDGPAHLSRLVAALVDARRPLDDDVTEVTDGELAWAVARYLRHQEGVETQLARAPALEDPAWGHIVTGPRGELYDLEALGRAARVVATGEARARGEQAAPGVAPPTELDRDALRRRSAPAPEPPREKTAGGPEAEAMRQLCRLRALDLPLRALGPAQHAAAVADALARAALPRSARVVVLWSTLGKERQDEPAGLPTALVRSLGLMRRRRHRLTWLVPVLPEPAGELDSRDAAVAMLTARADRARGAAAADRLRAMGVGVATVAPGEARLPPHRRRLRA